jgi:hypothetical protein
MQASASSCSHNMQPTFSTLLALQPRAMGYKPYLPVPPRAVRTWRAASLSPEEQLEWLDSARRTFVRSSALVGHVWEATSSRSAATSMSSMICTTVLRIVRSTSCSRKLGLPSRCSCIMAVSNTMSTLSSHPSSWQTIPRGASHYLARKQPWALLTVAAPPKPLPPSCFWAQPSFTYIHKHSMPEPSFEIQSSRIALSCLNKTTSTPFR